MASDTTSYLLSRITNELAKEANIGVSSKYQQVQEASVRNTQALDAILGRARLREALNERSLVSKFDIDPEGVLGQAVNTFAAFSNQQQYSHGGPDRNWGQVVADTALGVAGGFAGLGEAVGNAYGLVTGDMDNALADVAGGMRQRLDANKSDPLKAKIAARQANINEADSLWGKFVAAAGDTIMDPALMGDVVATNFATVVPGALVGKAAQAGTLARAMAVGPLPQAVAKQVAIEAAKRGTAASLLTGAVQQGTDVAAQAYDDALADGSHEDSLAAARAAFLPAAALSLAANAVPGGTLLERTLVGGAARETVKAGTRLALPKALAKGMLGEGVQEALEEGGGQFAANVAKQIYVNPDQQLDEGVGENAGLGFAGGFGMGVVGGLGQRQADKDEAQEAAASIQRARVTALRQAALSGDVSALVDPNSEVYRPAHAIMALGKNAELEGATDERRQANLSQAQQVMADVEARRDALKASLEKEPPASKKERSKQEQLLSRLDAEVELAQQRLTEFATRSAITAARAPVQENPAPETPVQEPTDNGDTDVGRLVAQIEAPAVQAADGTQDPVVEQTRTKATEQLFNLSMAAPERVSAEVAKNLADNQNNGLSQEQRDYLNQFAATKGIESKTLEQVSNEVRFGGGGNLGLENYKQRLKTALLTGDQVRASRDLELLTKFATGHKAKAIALIKAWKMGRGTQILQDANGKWQILGTPMEKAELKKQGGLVAGSDKLVLAVKAEANLLDSWLKTLNAAYAVRFPNPTTQPAQGVSNVPNLPQALDQASLAAVANPQVPVAPGVGQETDGGAVGTAPEVGAGSNGSVDSANPAVTPTPEARPAAQTAAKLSQSQSTEGTQTQLKEVEKTEDAVEAQLQSNQNDTASAESAEVQTSSESSEKTSVDQSNEADTERSSHGLTVLNTSPAERKAEKSKAFRMMNRAKAWLTQKKPSTKANEDGGNPAKDRPLAVVPAFLDRWSKDEFEVADFFPNGELASENDPDGHKLSALTTFRGIAKDWIKKLDANLIKGSLPNSKGNKVSEDQLFRDPIQNFFNEDGTVDENLKTAIAYGAYSWLVRTLQAPAYQSDREALWKLLGKKNHDGYISPAGWDMLSSVTSTEETAFNSLGREVVAALGIKASSDASADYLPRLTTALGVHALKLLEDAGVVETRSYLQTDLAQHFEGYNAQEKVYNTYVQVVRDAKTLKPSDLASKILASVKGSEDILAKLFGSSNDLDTGAQTSPIPFNQSVAKDTNQKITRKQKRILKEAHQHEHRLIPEMWSAMQALGQDVLLKVAGYVEYDEKRIQAMNRKSVQAQNDNLERQLQSLIDLTNGDSSKPFFLAQEVWSQFRVGIKTRDLNPQSSKIHRFMVARPEWTSTIQLDDQQAVEQFLVSVAQAFGVKVDQQPNEETVGKLNDLVAKKDLADMSKALVQGKLTVEQQQAIGDFAAGAEGMQSLQAMVAYGKYLAAQEAGQKDVTVTILVGVDGKTNGPILTHLALGAAASVEQLASLMRRGGMYRAADAVSNFNHWYKQAASLDLYEDLSSQILKGIPEKLEENTPEMQALFLITKPLMKDGKVTSAGRNLSKTPLTAFVFGSTVSNSVKSMQMAFVDSVVKRIESVANGQASDITAAQLVDSINRLLVLGDRRIKPLPADVTIEQLIDWKITKQQHAALETAFNQLLGFKTEEVMESYFGELISRRNAITKASGTAFHLYKSTFESLRKAELERAMDAGEITFTTVKGERIPDRDLSEQQMAALKEKVKRLQPVVHTAYSKEEGSLDAGLYLANQERNTNSLPYYSVAVQMGKPFSTPGNPRQTQVRASSQPKTETDPGVKALVLMMHSLDSSVMHESIEGTQSLNVHDEAGNGVSNVVRTAQKINAATWKALLNYSPMNEAYEMLERSILNMADMIEKGELEPTAVRDFVTAYTESGRKWPGFEAMMSHLAAQRYEADRNRLALMSEMTAVDQYTWEGGQYDVTDADRAEAKKRLEATIERGAAIHPDTQKAINALNGYLKKKAAPKVSKQTPQPVQQEPVEDSAGSPFGTLGAPASLDAGLVELFATNPNPDLKTVLRQLYKSVRAKGNNRFNEFQLALLAQLSKTLDGNTRIQLITRDSTEADVLAMPKQPSLGWIVPDGNKSVVYVLGKDFVNSGLQSTETLIHELVHAAVAHAVAAPSEAVKPMIEELNRLKEKAKEFVEKNNLNQFLHLVNSSGNVDQLQEFIAWGMSNAAFQREVLNKVTTQPRTKKESLVNGMKAFIDAVVGILFKGSSKSPQQIAVNGMTILVNNVSGLMAAKTDQGADFNLSMAVAVNDYDTLQVHDALNGGNISAAFDEQLRGLLSGIVDKLHGPFGALKASFTGQTVSALDAWTQAVSSGAASLASTLQAAPFPVSQKELHAMEQVEATVKAAIDTQDASVRVAYRELVELFIEMRDKLKAEVSADPVKKAMYDFAFTVTPNAQGKSDHLARFAALSLAHEGFNALMQKPSEGKAKAKPKTFAQRVQKVFEDILAFFEEKLTHTFKGQRADKKLQQLVQQLVGIEAKRKLSLQRAARSAYGVGMGVVDPRNLTQMAEDLANAAANKVKGAIGSVASSKMVTQSKYAAVRTAGSVTRLYANNQIDTLMDTITEFRDQHFKGLHGLFMQTFNQIKGPGQVLNMLQVASTKLQDTRKDIITQVGKSALGAFTTLDKKDTKTKAALSQVLLRTGLHVLTDGTDKVQLAAWLKDAKARQQTMTELEDQLRQDPNVGSYVDHFIHQANALAYYRVTGEVRHHTMMMNAHNIVRLYGTAGAKKVAGLNLDAAEALVEKLVSLYALDYVSDVDRNRVVSLLDSENQRTDGGNGIEFVLKLHKKLDESAKAELFAGSQKALFMHGYTPEIINPHTAVTVANEADGVALMRQGYVQVHGVLQDRADPNKEVRHLYVLRDGGLARYQSGSLSLSSKKAKGSRQHSGYLNVNTADGLDNASFNADVTAAKPRGLSRGPRPDLRNEGEQFMAPVVNPQGQIVNWRYLMNDRTKDSVLERNNNFEELLGVIAGSTFDKKGTPALNRQVLDALYEQHEAEYLAHPDSYVMVGPATRDRELRQLWDMLPKETKDYARSLFGQDGIYIRKDALLPVFGYRKFSFSQAWDKDPKDRALMEKVVMRTMELFLVPWARMELRKQGLPITKDAVAEYTRRGAVLVTRGERVWQELVHEFKDIVVVKSLMTTVNNVRSNLSQLAIAGVPLTDIARHHLVAMRAATEYEDASGELAQLELKKSVGMGGPDIDTQIALLKDTLHRNPVRELIEAGLMPSIVEDVSSDEDPYSYKSMLARKTEGWTKKLNPKVLEAAKFVYMTQDTKLYQGLSRFTRLSDFVARYTLYQHLTKRADKPLSKADAIHEASEAFVNYDAPLPKQLQYLDDMGFVPFIRYYLRMQRVIAKAFRDNPGRALTTLLLDQTLGLGPIVLEGSWVAHMDNNPFQAGALQLPGVLDDIATVNTALALLK